MRAAITGASGFIGRNLVRSTAFRTWSTSSLDLRALHQDPPALRAALEGNEVVIHLAAIAHRFGGIGEGEYHRVNAELPVQVAREAAAAGVRHFIFMSTAKVGGDETRGQPLTEEQEAAPTDAYSRAKLEAETQLRELSERSQMAITIIRPPVVYGPGVKANFAALLRLVSRLRANPFAGIRTRRSILYAGNLAAAVSHFALRPVTSPYSIYYVADPDPPTLEELGDMIVAAAGASPRRLPIPAILNRSLAATARRHKRLKGLFGEFLIDTSALERTGFIAPYTTRTGLENTLSEPSGAE